MELQNNSRPIDDPARRLGMPQPAKQAIEQVVEHLDRAQADRASNIRASLERVSISREVQESRVQQLRERIRNSGTGDRLDLSRAAQLFFEEDPDAQQVRAELIRSLKTAYQQGNINTRARIELAAERLLGGE